MNKYRVTAPDGRSLIITGDSPPSEEELEEIFASLVPKKDTAFPAIDASKLVVGGEKIELGKAINQFQNQQENIARTGKNFIQNYIAPQMPESGDQTFDALIAQGYSPQEAKWRLNIAPRTAKRFVSGQDAGFAAPIADALSIPGRFIHSYATGSPMYDYESNRMGIGGSIVTSPMLPVGIALGGVAPVASAGLPAIAKFGLGTSLGMTMAESQMRADGGERPANVAEYGLSALLGTALPVVGAGLARSGLASRLSGRGINDPGVIETLQKEPSLYTLTQGGLDKVVRPAQKEAIAATRQGAGVFQDLLEDVGIGAGDASEGFITNSIRTNIDDAAKLGGTNKLLATKRKALLKKLDDIVDAVIDNRKGLKTASARQNQASFDSDVLSEILESGDNELIDFARQTLVRKGPPAVSIPSMQNVSPIMMIGPKQAASSVRMPTTMADLLKTGGQTILANPYISGRVIPRVSPGLGVLTGEYLSQ